MNHENLKNLLGNIDISESDLARPCGNDFNDIDKREILLKVAKEKGVEVKNLTLPSYEDGKIINDFWEEVPGALPPRCRRHFEHSWSIDNNPNWSMGPIEVKKE